MKRFLILNGPSLFGDTDSIDDALAWSRLGVTVGCYVQPAAISALAQFIVESGAAAEARLLRRQFKVERLASDPRCDYCGKPLTPAIATVDHVVAIAEGGTETRENFRLACQRCNNDKDRQSLNEYFERLTNARAFREWAAGRELSAA